MRNHPSPRLLPPSPLPSQPNFLVIPHLGHELFTPPKHSPSLICLTLLSAFVWRSHSSDKYLLRSCPSTKHWDWLWGDQQPPGHSEWAWHKDHFSGDTSSIHTPSVGDSLGCFEFPPHLEQPPGSALATCVTCALRLSRGTARPRGQGRSFSLPTVSPDTGYPLIFTQL